MIANWLRAATRQAFDCFTSAVPRQTSRAFGIRGLLLFSFRIIAAESSDTFGTPPRFARPEL